MIPFSRTFSGKSGPPILVASGGDEDTWLLSATSRNVTSNQILARKFCHNNSEDAIDRAAIGCQAVHGWEKDVILVVCFYQGKDSARIITLLQDAKSRHALLRRAHGRIGLDISSQIYKSIHYVHISLSSSAQRHAVLVLKGGISIASIRSAKGCMKRIVQATPLQETNNRVTKDHASTTGGLARGRWQVMFLVAQTHFIYSSKLKDNFYSVRLHVEKELSEELFNVSVPMK